MVDLVLRTFTLTLFLIWRFYWFTTERKADREKPKAELKIFQGLVKQWFSTVLGLFLTLQLFGFVLFPFPYRVEIQITGFLMVVIGIAVSISARASLGTNWTHAAEYQIKKRHSLVTHGIYKFIRHPIYAGLFLSYIGGTLVAQSWLFIVFIPIIAWWSYMQGQREEKLLRDHFGNEYTLYMKKSKMFIPYIF